MNGMEWNCDVMAMEWMEWRWNGDGMAMGMEWRWNGDGMDGDGMDGMDGDGMDGMDGDGMDGMAMEWRWNGIAMEWNGMAMECKPQILRKSGASE